MDCASGIRWSLLWAFESNPAGQCLQEAPFPRIQEYHGYNADSALLTGGFTLFWLNLSPFYIQKESEQIRALKTIWTKIGVNIKVYNDLVTKTTTSTSLDKDTYRLYENRNSAGAGVIYPEEDSAPYFLPDTRASTRIKRIFL